MKPKKLSKSRQARDKIEGEEDQGGAESLPSYARTYILPRKTTLARLDSPSPPPEFDPSLMREETGLTREKMKSLVPCVGAERLRDYVDFIKEGNFYPLSVLDPEMGRNHQ